MLRWIDGFEHYGTDENVLLEGVGGAAAYSQVDGSWDLSSLNPATGASHMRLTASGSGNTLIIRRALGQSKQVCGIGYRLSLDDLPTHEDYASVLDSQLTLVGFRDVANSRQFRVNIGTEGSVHAVTEGTSLGRSDPVIAAGGYHHFEAKAKIHGTTGYVEVRVNEVTVLNLTGVDTHSSAAAECSQFVIGEFGDVTDPGAGFGFMDMDDLFAWDDDSSDPDNPIVDFVGDKGARFQPTIADTAEAGFLLSAGVSGYPLLDELAPNDTDYISDATGAARSIFEVEDLPANVAEVIAWMPVYRAVKMESGTVNMRAGVVVGAEESYTATESPSTSFGYMTPTPKAINPSTGVAWASNEKPDLLIERTA